MLLIDVNYLAARNKEVSNIVLSINSISRVLIRLKERLIPKD